MIAGQAQAATLAIADPRSQAHFLTRLVEVLAKAGQHKPATRLAKQAERLALAITSPAWQARVLTRLVAALTEAGQHEQAIVLAGQARNAPWSPSATPSLVQRVG